ncbi:MAG: hypothetical protein ACFFFG_09235 [Candidatus Thorarchaeota archaeon]
MLVYWIKRSNRARLGGASRLDISDLGFLLGTNLAGIVCLEQDTHSRALAEVLGASWLYVPLISGIPPTNAELEQIVKFVYDCEKTRSRAPILFHSAMGLDRPGTILAALLIILDGLPPGSAIKQIRAVNPLALRKQTDYDFISTFKYGFINKRNKH